MPELPEVETTLRGIAPHIHQQTIAKVTVRQHQLRWPIPRDIRQNLLGQTIIDLTRRGKYLLLNAQEGALLLHLGMSGNLRILTENLPAKKHDHVDIIFANNKILRFNDPRRFGAFLWLENDPYTHPLLKNLGIEPLSKSFSGQFLWSKAQNKTLPIKSLLMDGKIVTGIGNIYAAEALFAAGIHPALAANSLSVQRLEILVKEIKRILRYAIKKGGTTFRDFLNSEGKPGYFLNQLQVYGRDGLLCVKCHSPLQSLRIGQRSTVYCKNCQS